jgi:hypothetical protein
MIDDILATDLLPEGFDLGTSRQTTPPSTERTSETSAAGTPRFPAIRSKHPASLKLGEEGVFEYIPFP